MRHLIKHFALWDIVLIIGVAAIVMLIAARVSPNATRGVNEHRANVVTPTAHENAAAKHSSDSKPAVHKSRKQPQDGYYYERRRRYWEDRVERNLDEEEGSDDEDKADSKAKKGDEEDSLDQEEELIERRREYWRQRLDRDW